MSRACPTPFLCVGLLVSSRRIVALLHRVFPDGFRHRCTFRFCGGASPLVLGPVGTLGGVAVAPPISPYTGPGWSPPFCRVPLVLRSVFSVYCAAFRPYSWRSFGQFHCFLRVHCASPPYGVVPWTFAWGVTGWPYCPPPRSSRTLSFALTSGHDSTVLIPPAIDSGESPSFTVGLTPCYCGVLGGLHVLVGSSPGRLFEPSYLGRLLCLRMG